jgi:hypothetical protein
VHVLGAMVATGLAMLAIASAAHAHGSAGIYWTEPGGIEDTRLLYDSWNRDAEVLGGELLTVRGQPCPGFLIAGSPWAMPSMQAATACRPGV